MNPSLLRIAMAEYDRANKRPEKPQKHPQVPRSVETFLMCDGLSNVACLKPQVPPATSGRGKGKGKGKYAEKHSEWREPRNAYTPPRRSRSRGGGRDSWSQGYRKPESRDQGSRPPAKGKGKGKQSSH